MLVPYARLILCGPGRTGKSSLLRSLLGQSFQSESDSTVGVELKKVLCTIERSGVWKEIDSEYEHQLALTSKAVDKATQQIRQTRIESAIPDGQPASVSSGRTDVEEPLDLDCATEESSPRGTSHTHSACVASNSQGKAQASLSMPSSTPNKLDSTPSLSLDFSKQLSSATKQINRFLEDLRSGKGFRIRREQLSELIFLDAWDFAGQRVFAAIQHMVLACSRCAYAVLLNASLKLNGVAEPTIGIGGKEHLLENTLMSTNFDVLETWLNTIHEVVGDKDDVPVFVVGTHIDQVLSRKREALLEELKSCTMNNPGKAYASNIDDVVLVDNTMAGSRTEDPAVRVLRKEIVDKLKMQFSVATPVRWLPFTVAISHIAREYQRPWLSLADLRRVAEASGSLSQSSIQDDFQKMVKFHHDLGHILHFENNTRLRDWVIIDVAWLLRVLSLLFNPCPKALQHKKYRRQYAMLAEQGVLLETLAEQRWSQHDVKTRTYTSTEEQRKLLFDIAEHFALFYDTGCKIQVPGLKDGLVTRKFFVPALVTQVNHLQNEVQSGETTPAMYLCNGKSCYFPQTLFWCSVVRCMQRYSPSVDPILCPASARVLCRDAFWLVMKYFQRGIQLTILVPKRSNTQDGGDDQQRLQAVKEDVAQLCHEVLHYLESQLAEIKQFSLQHVHISRAVRCKCSNIGKKCREHNKSKCQDLNCEHHAPIVDGFCTRCPQDGKPEVDITDVREFWPCFVDDQVRV